MKEMIHINMSIILRISLSATLLLGFAVVARMLGIIDSKYVTIIMFISLAIQTILLIILIIFFIMIKRKRVVRIIRYQLENKQVKGETNIIPESISPTNPRKSAIFKIFLEIDNVSETPEIGIGITKNTAEKVATKIKDHVVNVESGIVNQSFIFDADIIVSPGEQINFQIKKDTNIKLFLLGEIYTP